MAAAGADGSEARLGGTVRPDMSIAFFDDDVDVTEVKGAIDQKAEEIGWNDVPRPAPESESETFYRVIRRG